MAIEYEKAPIVEALIDIRVQQSEPSALEGLGRVYDRVRDRYPKRGKTVQLHGRLSAGDPAEASATSTLLGWTFTSEDGQQVAQARTDGFTFSRLRPYQNWKLIREEARRLWEIYREEFPFGEVSRVAVRYINRIDIPHSLIDYKDYFRTTPEVSPELPQHLSGFFMQLQFPQDDFGGVVVLTQTSVPPPSEGFHSVILDLDVSKEYQVATTDEQIWQELELMRSRKNEFFEGCLTDETRQLFGERRDY